MVPTALQTQYALSRFRAIVEYARKNNRFYRYWITDPENVPIVDRKTFLENNKEILNGRDHNQETSGSTGIPVRFILSPERCALNIQDRTRFTNWLGGVVPAVFIVHPRTDEPRIGVLDIASTMEEQMTFIRRERERRKILAITTYPTNAEHLAQAVLEVGMDVSYITRFGLYGEAVEDHIPPLVRRAFPNARVWSTYSSREFGIISASCPHDPDYHHIMAHKVGIEVLDDQDRECEPGQTGRVVVTDYYNRDSPFIRYDIGDLAEPGTCTCGQIPLPAFRRIHGKIFNTILHRNGNRMVFYALAIELRHIPDIIQYQVIQHALEEFTVKVSSPRRIDSEVKATMAAYLGYEPKTIRVDYVDSIPRQPNGKFYAAICEV